jgi:hypothetical protein
VYSLNKEDRGQLVMGKVIKVQVYKIKDSYTKAVKKKEKKGAKNFGTTFFEKKYQWYGV